MRHFLQPAAAEREKNNHHPESDKERILGADERAEISG